jgi:hypothetical protein
MAAMTAAIVATSSTSTTVNPRELRIAPLSCARETPHLERALTPNASVVCG